MATCPAQDASEPGILIHSFIIFALCPNRVGFLTFFAYRERATWPHLPESAKPHIRFYFTPSRTHSHKYLAAQHIVVW